jgi:hypothetical protein
VVERDGSAEPAGAVVQQGLLHDEVGPLFRDDERLGALQVAHGGGLAAELVQRHRPGNQNLAEAAGQGVTLGPAHRVVQQRLGAGVVEHRVPGPGQRPGRDDERLLIAGLACPVGYFRRQRDVSDRMGGDSGIRRLGLGHEASTGDNHHHGTARADGICQSGQLTAAG